MLKITLTLALVLISTIVSANEKYKATATWYQCCKKTANGETFDPNGFTVAHRSYPFGTVLKLTNPKTNDTIIVRVNDRGPFIKGRDLDVTRGGAQALGFFHSGTARILIEVLEKKK
jgi:rare lipoprotein A